MSDNWFVVSMVLADERVCLRELDMDDGEFHDVRVHYSGCVPVA